MDPTVRRSVQLKRLIEITNNSASSLCHLTTVGGFFLAHFKFYDFTVCLSRGRKNSSSIPTTGFLVVRVFSRSDPIRSNPIRAELTSLASYSLHPGEEMNISKRKVSTASWINSKTEQDVKILENVRHVNCNHEKFQSRQKKGKARE